MDVFVMNTVFDYRCEYCKTKFEISFEGEGEISPSDLTVCPRCGRGRLSRDYKAENKSIHFKGEGFYSTDYGGKE